MDLRNPVRFNNLKNFERLIAKTKSRISGKNIPGDLITKFKEKQNEKGKKYSLINAVKIVPYLVDLKYINS